MSFTANIAPFVNVESYGALGNNSNDDTSAINSAVASFSSSPVGGIVYFPPGIYRTSGTILLNNNAVTLMGSGKGVTTIKPFSGANFDVISTPIPGTPGTPGFTINYISIQNLTVDGSLMSGTVDGKGNVIHTYGSIFGLIKDCTFISYPNWGILFDGDSTNFGYNNTVENCDFNLGAAGAFQIQCEANNFRNNQFQYALAVCAAKQPNSSGNTNALHLQLSSGYAFVEENVFGNGGTYTNEAVRVSNNGPCKIINNRFDQTRSTAIKLNSGNGIVSGNSFGNCSSVDTTFAVQIGSNNNIINGNNFNTIAGPANYTYCVGESGGPFTGNIIEGNFFTTGTAGVISQNATSQNYIDHNSGYNPVGKLTAPAIPATTVAQNNNFGVDCMVLVTGGTVSNIGIGGQNTGQTSGWFRVPAGGSITLTYTVAPTWTWWGD